MSAPAGAAAPQSLAAEPLPLRLRVLTLNLHKGFTAFNRRFVLSELRQAVHAVDADLVFLQEVLGDDASARSRTVRWPGVSQYEYLADTLWPHYAYGRNAVYPEGHHGNALLSRLPIVRYENLDVSVAGPERRGVLHCQLQTPGAMPVIHALCAHLGLLAAHRRRQIERMCALIDALPADEPVLLAGDFNDWGTRACDMLARVGLREVFVSRIGHCARTFPAWAPVLRLDRIYWRGGQVRAARVLSRVPWSRLSDHAALLAEIEP